MVARPNIVLFIQTKKERHITRLWILHPLTPLLYTVLDVTTAPSDKTILPGVTQDSCLVLLRARASSALILPSLPCTYMSALL